MIFVRSQADDRQVSLVVVVGVVRGAVVVVLAVLADVFGRDTSSCLPIEGKQRRTTTTTTTRDDKPSGLSSISASRERR